MAGACDTIEDDPGDGDTRPPLGKASHQWGDGLAVPVSINDENHRKLERLRQIARGTLSICSRIKQAHRPFNQQEIGPGGLLASQCPQLIARHGPRVEIDGFPPRGAPGKMRIDIIRSGFGRRHNHASSTQSREQA